MTARTSRRRQYTPEEKEARAAADRLIREQADARLSDPQGVLDLVMMLVDQPQPSPKLLRYSLRNQALLVDQAARRGIPLSDVDTLHGWRARGRGVRKGETGLRIVAPKGVKSSKTEDDTPKPDTEPPEKEQRTLFRMMSVFDRSQTEGADDDGLPEPLDVTAATVLWESLYEQVENRGYRIVGEGETDHDAKTVFVDLDGSTIDMATQLALAVSEILTRTPVGAR